MQDKVTKENLASLHYSTEFMVKRGTEINVAAQTKIRLGMETERLLSFADESVTIY